MTMFIKGIMAAVLIVAVCSFGTSADAQKAAKESTTQKKAPPRVKPEAIAWYKLCYDVPNPKDPKTKRKECATSYEIYQPITGQLMLLALVKTDANNENAAFMVTLPLGMFIPNGAQVRIDEGKPVALRYVYCAQPGCVATIPAQKDVPDFIKKLQKGGKLIVVSSTLQGQPYGLEVPLKGFTSALKGKSSTREKYVARAKEIQSSIKARQEEIKKRIAEAKKQQKEKE